MIDEDLAEFLSSKLEFKVYHFVFFAIRAREKFFITCTNMLTISKIQNIQWVLLFYLLLTSLSLTCIEYAAGNCTPWSREAVEN